MIVALNQKEVMLLKEHMASLFLLDEPIPEILQELLNVMVFYSLTFFGVALLVAYVFALLAKIAHKRGVVLLDCILAVVSFTAFLGALAFALHAVYILLAPKAFLLLNFT